MGTANKYQPDPHVARLARADKRRESLLPIADALNEALTTATALLHSADDNTKLRAVHAVTQCANTYARLYEVGELEYRVAMLEAPPPPPELSTVPAEELDSVMEVLGAVGKLTPTG